MAEVKVAYQIKTLTDGKIELWVKVVEAEGITKYLFVRKYDRPRDHYYIRISDTGEILDYDDDDEKPSEVYIEEFDSHGEAEERLNEITELIRKAVKRITELKKKDKEGEIVISA